MDLTAESPYAPITIPPGRALLKALGIMRPDAATSASNKKISQREHAEMGEYTGK